MPLAPLDDTITLSQLTNNPYPAYREFRAKTPVLRVKALGRTLLTKAEHTKAVKDNPVLFSSDDPNTPMERAFQAKTLMRRDGEDHMRLRKAMMPAFSAKNIREVWSPLYMEVAEDYVGRLPRGETVDFFTALAGPVAARCLAHLLGIEKANDEEMQFWSQALINGAGNFGWQPGPFEISDEANSQINKCIDEAAVGFRENPNQSALSVMVNADNPIEMEHVCSNIKIAIGGGLNEPRDSLMTVVYGLLTNPEQLAAAKENSGLWMVAFEEAIRWVAPIQVSSRLVIQDTEIGGFSIPKGDTVMTSQASANHDEDAYEDGHLFNVFRKKASHQAFGNGPHFCMGTHISRRMVGEILLPLLFDRFPNLSLPDPDKVIFKGFGFRGPVVMPITLN